MSVNEISPTALADIARGQPIDLIDVCTPAEFESMHAASARSIPLDRLELSTVMRNRLTPADHPVYVICRSGSRGRRACEGLQEAGCSVVNVAGGTLAWEQAGLELVRGRQSMSLERQVRIVAGLLVLIGAVLGWFVHPLFVALSAFVGAGLIVAGATDMCGMGLMLARMPWNRDGGKAGA